MSFSSFLPKKHDKNSALLYPYSISRRRFCICESLLNAALIRNLIDDIYNSCSDALSEIENALDNINCFVPYFEFFPENVLNNEECERLNNVEKAIHSQTYESIIDNLTSGQQLELLSLLQEKQKKQPE